MVFSSITFLLYFLPIVFLVYYILAFSRPLQNIWLVIASLLFYAWGEPIYVFLMLASITCNWLFGMMLLWIRKDKVKARRLVLIIACVLNLGMLGIFKYSGFVVETVNGIMERPFLPYPNIVLPIGISFFTFQALSYVIDVYMGNAEPQKNLLDIALYVAFFPQLIAGPIVKYSAIAEQIKTRRTDLTMLTEGICRFCEGFCKKILIANNLAVIADTVFNLTKGGDSTIPVPMLLAWLGAVSYMFQLYYDFSAYSDMAIGLGLMSGLWHGANWTYIWWGLYFFILIIFEILFRLDEREGHEVLRHVYVVVATVFAMVIFRCETGEQMSLFFADLFALGGNGFYSPSVVMFLKEYGISLIGAVLFALPVRNYILEKTEDSEGHEIFYRSCGVIYVICLGACMIFSIAILAKGGYNPFIYFNF